MTRRQRFLSIVIGCVGAIGSFVALVDFLLKVRGNALQMPRATSTQAFYQSVGAAYSDGFVAGFSLSFFLALLAVAVGTWFEGRRETGRLNTDSVRIPLVGGPPRA